ncbi:MAG: hypothetical protein CM15mP122_1890 [Bacteroidota bacterium]|nr:MAG: hypothetical protein CM15mP122_1890 [Bacteroidota bacterium]
MTLTINKGTPTISFSNLTKTYGDANFDLSATSSSTGGLTHSIADANIASLSVSNVTIVGAGTTSITVTQAADANYNSATSTITLTVSKLNTTITLSDITKSALDADFDLDANPVVQVHKWLPLVWYFISMQAILIHMILFWRKYLV